MKSTCPERWCDFFKAIHDHHRQHILELLNHYHSLSANQIVAKISLSQPTVSHHLKILNQAKIINCKRQGKEIIYSINTESIKKCCGGFLERFASNPK